MDLVLRKATEDDCDLIFEYANDKSVRANSFNQEEIKYEDHQKWFNKRIHSDNTKMYILCDGDIPLGQVRSDYNGNEAIISYMISKENRGKGLAVKMLEMLQANTEKGITLVAKVKKDNIASAKVFKKLGYEESIDGEILIYTKAM